MSKDNWMMKNNQKNLTQQCYYQRKWKKYIYFCQCHTENDDECPLFYYHKHGDIYFNALSAPLSCFKNVQIHTAQNSANKTLNNKTKSLMTLTPFYS